MEKELWSISTNGEDFTGEYESKEEAIAAGNESAWDDEKEGFSIGRMVKPDVSSFVDVDFLLERVEESANDFGGEWAENYPQLDEKQREELGQLIANYIVKCDSPNFWGITDIEEYETTEE